MRGKRPSSARSRSRIVESTEPDIWCISRERRGPGHIGGNSKWAGAYQGKAKVLEYFGRQAQATETAAEIHDILGNDEHVVVLGSAKATARDGSSAEWKYTQVFHIRDGKTTEVWGMAENDAAVDPFLDSLPD